MRKQDNEKGLLYLFEFSGRNFTNFLNSCIELNLTPQLIERIDSLTVRFFLSSKDAQVLKKSSLSNFAVKQISEGGLKKILHLCIYRIGLIIGLVVSFVFLVVFNNRLLQFHIWGVDEITQKQVIESIKDYGISKFSSMNFRTDELEKYLMTNFDFSLVSIVTKGNSMIINIKEELSDSRAQFDDITANYNMIIKDIQVFSGTSNIGKGDIVFKGDTLVSAYYQDNGEKFYIEPKAKIDAEVFFCESYTFKNTEPVYQRTGNKTLLDMSLGIGNKGLKVLNQDNPYQSFELEEKNSLYSYYFLPIFINKVYAYQTELKSITHNFEEERQQIINRLEIKIQEQLPLGLSDIVKDVIITPVDEGCIINYYVKGVMSWTY
ncbi:MAG: sporulation protein YqfD [Clostridia bacterium]|nr:sporulation protein YqfD [Clostridia bacterium]